MRFKVTLDDSEMRAKMRATSRAIVVLKVLLAVSILCLGAAICITAC